MAKECVFCRSELGFGEAKKLYMSNFHEAVCKSCYDKYSAMPQLELANALLDTHRAKNEDAIRKYIPVLEKAQTEAEAEAEKQAQSLKLQKEWAKCLPCAKCGGDTKKYRTELKLGEETFFLSDLNRLLSGSLTVDMVRCTKCAYTEFYTPFAEELEDD